MRRILDHVVTEADRGIEIAVVDAPGAGGAHHRYEILVPGDQTRAPTIYELQFQNGPAVEQGVNGLTQEALIAICIDRLRCFQSGPFSCRENALALTHLQDAMHWLQHRTRDRMSRGVEGRAEK